MDDGGNPEFKAKKKVAKGAKPKVPKAATPQRLNNIALYYLERFSSSSENLRRVLMRRVDKSHYELGTDKEEGRAAIDDIITRFIDSGLLNDAEYARSVAFSQHRSGKSSKAIRMRLMSKGVSSDDIDAALEILVEEVGAHSDIEAAMSYARKRKLGPYRTKDREGRRDRDLAALGRQGFSYDIARKIVDADDVEAMKELLSE